MSSVMVALVSPLVVCLLVIRGWEFVKALVS